MPSNHDTNSLEKPTVLPKSEPYSQILYFSNYRHVIVCTSKARDYSFKISELILELFSALFHTWIKLNKLGGSHCEVLSKPSRYFIHLRRNQTVNAML